MIQLLETVFWLAVFLILYTYVFYFFVLFFIAAIVPKKRKKNEKYFPSVSFVIAAYNEKKVIEAKIKNCISLKYPKSKIEFIFGSDHSIDGTNAIIKRFARTHAQIKLVPFKKREGKAGVINKIVPKAKGTVLLFSDANTIYHAESVRKMVSHFADPAVGGVCGKLILVKPNKNVGGQGETLYWGYENRIKYLEGKIKTVFGATGGIYAIRKQFFQKLPKHKTNISDDFLIPMKIVEKGFDVVYDKNAIAREYASLTMKDEFSRKVRIGAANLYALHKIKCLLNPRRGFVAFGLWSHKIIRWLVPFLMLLLVVLNVFLLDNQFFLMFFIIQILFYLFACVGWLFDRKGIQYKPFSILYYVVSINLALLVGYYKYITGTIQPMWARLER